MGDKKIVPTFDKVSQLWIEPFSILINCMFPVEWVFNDWIYWRVESDVECDQHSASAAPSTEVPSGSRVEGFCVPRLIVTDFESKEETLIQPDFDTMTVKSRLNLLNETQIFAPIFTVEHIADDPRYVNLPLPLTPEWKADRPRFADVKFLHQSFLLRSVPDFTNPTFTVLQEKAQSEQVLDENRGPVLKMQRSMGEAPFCENEVDYANVFEYPDAWPEPAMEWLVRQRPSGWPSPKLVQEIFEAGCHLAPVGRGKRAGKPIDKLEYMRNPKVAEKAHSEQDNLVRERVMNEFEWRMSFSVAENLLGQSVTPVQRHVIVLLKLIKKFYFPEVICSYHLKNLLFWECERRGETFWREETSAQCLLHMLDRLKECLEEGCLPHYIIPQSNLLQDEDPANLAQAAAAVADVRKNILQKTDMMFRQVMSTALLSSLYYQGLTLTDFLVKIQDPTLTRECIRDLKISMYRAFVKQCNEMVTRTTRMAGQEQYSKSNMMPLYCYQSLLARILGYLWVLQNGNIKDDWEEKFKAFLFENSALQNAEFIEVATESLRHLQLKKEPSLLIPNTALMKHNQESQKEFKLETLNEMPVEFGVLTQLLDTLESSDMEARMKNIAESFSLENVKNEDIEAALAEEVKKLLTIPLTQKFLGN